ncbi:MAG: hypothetical protein IJK52_03795 [Oscillospiraceae bacterium]|nr:hypothetical protein [Oscillospiraceae bacterium]
MPAISLFKKPDEMQEEDRPSIKWKLSYGHVPVKRAINFATVGEKPIDWRIASPSIVLIVLIAAIIGKVAVVDRFAALNAARNEVYQMQAQISEREDYYKHLTDISEDYSHYTTSEMTEEEKDRVSRVTVMDVAQRLILPVDQFDAWTVNSNTLTIHISALPLTEITAMAERILADPAVVQCSVVSQSATASSTENVVTEEFVTADMTVVFKGTLKIIEENRAAKAAAEAAAQTMVEEGKTS